MLKGEKDEGWESCNKTRLVGWGLWWEDGQQGQPRGTHQRWTSRGERLDKTRCLLLPTSFWGPNHILVHFRAPLEHEELEARNGQKGCCCMVSQYEHLLGSMWSLTFRASTKSSIAHLLGLIWVETFWQEARWCVRTLGPWKDLQIDSSSHRADLMLGYSSSDQVAWHLWVKPQHPEHTSHTENPTLGEKHHDIMLLLRKWLTPKQRIQELLSPGDQAQLVLSIKNRSISGLFPFLRGDISNILDRCFDRDISNDVTEPWIAWAMFDPDPDGQNGTGKAWATDMAR